MESFNKILIFGGTGSLGTALVKRFIKNNTVCVFSRSEEKHRIIKNKFNDVHNFIGDVRDPQSISSVLRKFSPNIIINAAALKQIPACEDFPFEALLTNTIGEKNIGDAIEQMVKNDIYDNCYNFLSISTDKACLPVNSYAFTKALQERIHLNYNSKKITSNCVRYGNVLESTGSVIPVFKKMIKEGCPLTVTQTNMTRFFLSLEQAVDLIEIALREIKGGKIFVPKVPSAKIIDLARIMDPTQDPIISGIRPGEKIHEILISKEELRRTEDQDKVFVIHDIKTKKDFYDLHTQYSSKSNLMSKKQLKNFLIEHGILDE